MKSRSKFFILALTALVSGFAPKAYAQKESHGGSAVVCFNTQSIKDQVEKTLQANLTSPYQTDPLTPSALQDITSVRMFDLVEVTERGILGQGKAFQPIQGSGDFRAILTERLSTLSRVSKPFFDEVDYVRTNLIKDENWNGVQNGIVKIDDSAQKVEMSTDCLLIQLAAQEDVGSVTRLFYDSRLFKRLPSVDQASLIFHEWIYRIAISLEQKDSRATREAVRRIFSVDFEHQSFSDSVTGFAQLGLMSQPVNDCTFPYERAGTQAKVTFYDHTVLLKAEFGSLSVSPGDQISCGSGAVKFTFPSKTISFRGSTFEASSVEFKKTDQDYGTPPGPSQATFTLSTPAILTGLPAAPGAIVFELATGKIIQFTTSQDFAAGPVQIKSGAEVHLNLNGSISTATGAKGLPGAFIGAGETALRCKTYSTAPDSTRACEIDENQTVYGMTIPLSPGRKLKLELDSDFNLTGISPVGYDRTPIQIGYVSCSVYEKITFYPIGRGKAALKGCSLPAQKISDMSVGGWTTFYSNGALFSTTTGDVLMVDGIPLKRGSVMKLYSDGHLREGTIAHKMKIKRRKVREGYVFSLDEMGNVISTRYSYN